MVKPWKSNWSKSTEQGGAKGWYILHKDACQSVYRNDHLLSSVA